MKRNRNGSALLTSGALLLGLGMGSTLAPSPNNWLVASAYAQDDAQDANEGDQLIRTLFSNETSPEQFEAAMQQAEEAKVPAQVILEAKIVRTFFTGDTEALLALSEPLQKAGANLDLENSQMFDVRTDYDSLVQALMALDAGQKSDAAGFEKHIKEAIWLASPTFQTLYLTWLKNYRDAQAMSNIVVPLETKLITSDGKETSFKEVLGTNKALLIDFWASWCGPCMNAMDDLKNKGSKLAPQGVIVLGLNTESDAGIAATVKKQKNIALPWLVEPKGEPYSGLLKVDSIPRAVLVSPEGKVLYNGHPSDPALNAALAKLGANL